MSTARKQSAAVREIEQLSAYEPGPGDIVVLRRLVNIGRSTPGPKVGQITRELGAGQWRVRLWQGSPLRRGGARFAKQGRTVERTNIDRLATAREALLGHVIDHVEVRS